MISLHILESPVLGSDAQDKNSHCAAPWQVAALKRLCSLDKLLLNDGYIYTHKLLNPNNILETLNQRQRKTILNQHLRDDWHDT